ncbi:MAG TPA: MerR family transcriptional regulator, partial [Micromonosporaceae bacterium]
MSSRSGVSIATIKFYVREGLLPGGTITGRNQADYSEEHLRRLHLVRALIDVGKLSVANARSVLAAVDTPGLPPHDLLKAAHCSLDRPNRRDPSHPDWQAARQVVLDLISRRGWYADETMAQVDVAADAVAAFHSLGQEDLLSCLDTYAEVVERVAEAELG